MLQSRHQWCIWAFFLSLTCCGDNVSIKDASGNAMLVLDAKPNAPVDGLNMTLNEVRIWKSTPNDHAPGVYTAIDDYVVEIWATLEGETQSRTFRESGFLADNQGDLYKREFAPGQIIYYNEADAPIADTPASYMISNSDPFINRETSAGVLLKKSAVSGTTTTSTQVAVDPAQIAQTPWPEVKYREYSQTMFQRMRQEKNANFTTKAKMGCLLVNTAGGNVDYGSYLFADVELGNTVRLGSQTDSHDTSVKGVQASDKSGADNYLIMEWQESWYLTGLNVTTKKVRMVRERWVPFYHGRELPGVDRSTTAPVPSGLEALVRSCNAAASGGAFRLVYMKPDVTTKSATLNISSDDNAYCAALKSAVAADAAVVRSIPLNNTNYTGNYSPAGTDAVALGCNFPKVLVSAGTWTGGPTAGQYHDGNITPPTGSTYFHFEQSKVADIAL